MHLQVNRSKIKPLNIPPGVLFWKNNECLIPKETSTKMIVKGNRGTISKLSLTIFVCSLLFDKVLSLINLFQ
jgi:hypothetical protein